MKPTTLPDALMRQLFLEREQSVIEHEVAVIKFRADHPEIPRASDKR